MIETADGECSDGEEWWRGRKGCNFKQAGQGRPYWEDVTWTDLKEVKELAIWISGRGVL